MIARTSMIDLLGVSALTSQAPAAKAMLGGGTTRFDAALLQATKTLSDTTTDGPGNQSSGLQQAFEAALETLSQRTLDQLKAMATNGTALKSIVDKAAQDAGLNAEEKSALANLTAAALPRLTAFKTETLSMGTPATTDGVGGAQPGPQGGTPATAATPADSLSSAPTRKTQQNYSAPTSIGIAALAQQLLSPVVVSTRTDDGSQSSGLVSLAAAEPAQTQAPLGTQPFSPAPMQADPQGKVITLAGQNSNTEATNAVPQGPVQTAPAAQAPMMNPNVTETPQSAAPAATVTQGLDPQVTVLQGQEPIAVQAESILSLNGDGQWSGAKALVEQAQAASSQPEAGTEKSPSQPQATAGGIPQTQAQTVTGNTPSQPQAPAAEVPPQMTSVTGKTSSESGTPGSAENTPSQPLAQAEGAASAQYQPSPSAVFSNPQTPATGTTPSQAPQPQAQAVTGTTPSQPQAQANAQPQGATSLLPQFNRAQTVAVENSAHEGAGTSPQNTVGLLAWTSQNTPVSKPADSTAPLTPLAQIGQDAGNGLAAAAPKDAQQQNVVQQVTQALSDAQNNGSSRIVIRLKPDSLGDVQVDLLMSNGKLSARLVAANTEVHQAFVRDLAGFKTGLESHGVSVQEVSVALRAGIQDQPQGQPRQPQDQSWWRQAQNQSNGGSSLPVTGGYSGRNLSIDQRFSALA